MDIHFHGSMDNGEEEDGGLRPVSAVAKIIYISQLWLKLYIFHSCRMIIDAPLLISPSHFWGEDAGQNRNEVIVIFFVLFCFDFVVVVVFFCYFVFCLLRS